MGRRKRRKKYGAFLAVFLVLAVIFGIEAAYAVNLFRERLGDTLAGHFSPEIPYQQVSVSEEDLEEKFYYDQLPKEEKKVYREICQGLKEVGSEIYVHFADARRANALLDYVLKDHPEIFWCDGTVRSTQYEGEESYTVLEPVYTCSKEEREARQDEIDAAAAECLAKAEKETSDYGKIRCVFDYIVDNVDYDRDAQDNQNIYSVFANRRSVCAGYAKATQYLLERLGVFCTYVSGKVRGGESHAWNLVRCDGDYYYVDTTWGDPVFQGDESAVENDYVSYDYLCCSEKELFRTHEPDGDTRLPPCTKMDCNYYVMNGVYYESYDREAVLKAMNETISAKENPSVFKFSDEESYRKAKDGIFGDLIGRAAENLAERYGLEKVQYVYIDDPELNKIVIYWQYE